MLFLVSTIQWTQYSGLSKFVFAPSRSHLPSLLASGGPDQDQEGLCPSLADLLAQVQRGNIIGLFISPKSVFFQKQSCEQRGHY